MQRFTVVAALIALATVAPVRGDEFASRQYALLVGVQDYGGTQLADLRHAENDVAALAGLLRTAGGYQRVTLLTKAEAFKGQKLDQFPTAANVRAHLTALLADRGPGDTALVAFAGHGVVLAGSNELYFCPQGADLARPKETLVSLTEVYAALTACRAGVRLLVVDACRNELTATRAGRPSVDLASDTRPELPKPPAGVAALFSCSAGEMAFESRRHPHGVFFHHLLEGLRGKAANRKGEVLLETLAGYVKGEMADTLLEEFGPTARQRPHLLGDVAGAVTVVRGRPGAAAAPPADDALRRGKELVADRRPEQAIAAFTDVLRRDPNAAAAYVGRARARGLAGDFAGAVEDSTAALRLNPRIALAYSHRAASLRELGDLDRAIADAAEAVRLDPQLVTAYVNRGDAYLEKRDYARALADFNEALRLNPRYATAYCYRGNVAARQRGYDRAIVDYDAALRLDPGHLIALRNRGLAYLHKGDPDRAIADLTEALRRDPKHAPAYLHRGRAFQAKGDAARSRQDFARYKQLTGKDP